MAEPAKKLGKPGGKARTGRHKSAIKRARQAVRRHRRNTIYMKRLRAALKAVRQAVTARDRAKAGSALKTALPLIDKTAVKGVIPKRRAARYVARLTVAVNRLAA
ncbi:MAG: 30S ribosomal protein S20 [Deltaproteobacteria bacterium]|nr:30S ribosomal protein S20 [Deltaproteobacteria bacterium]